LHKIKTKIGPQRNRLNGPLIEFPTARGSKRADMRGESLKIKVEKNMGRRNIGKHLGLLME
jgi:hypothetical protein